MAGCRDVVGGWLDGNLASEATVAVRNLNRGDILHALIGHGKKV